MPVFQKPVYVQQFCELDAGEVFVLVRDLERVKAPPPIFRKIDRSTANTENWEGEGCNRGVTTFLPDTEVVEVQ